MAKKMPARRRLQTRSAVSHLRSNIEELQRDTEKMLGRARKQALQFISRDQRRLLERLLSEARRLRSDFEKRLQRTTKRAEPRIERFFSTLEKRAEKRTERLVARLVPRLGLASREDVRGLSRRLGQLERRLRANSRARPQAAAPAPSLPPLPDVVAPSGGD